MMMMSGSRMMACFRFIITNYHFFFFLLLIFSFHPHYVFLLLLILTITVSFPLFTCKPNPLLINTNQPCLSCISVREKGHSLQSRFNFLIRFLISLSSSHLPIILSPNLSPPPVPRFSPIFTLLFEFSSFFIPSFPSYLQF